MIEHRCQECGVRFRSDKAWDDFCPKCAAAIDGYRPNIDPKSREGRLPQTYDYKPVGRGRYRNW